MKEGFVLPESENISDEDINLINKYTKREFNKNEVYIFSLVLCDNEIDRDYERFTRESLETLAKLFEGKTGILDHDAKSEKQLARIFSCKIQNLKIKNSLGENYSRLVAKAYIPKTKNSEEIITQIDSGIKKEISIRCRVEKKSCSICGDNINICHHTKGKSYFNGQNQALCYAILENPVDAYEWSFVAIPAQVAAGVIKTFSNLDSNSNQEYNNSLDIIEKFKNESNKKGMKNFYNIIKNMENEIKIGRDYINSIRQDVSKYLSFFNPDLNNNIIKKITDSLDFEDLKNLKDNFSKNISVKAQLASEFDKKDLNQFSEFKI